MASEIKPIAESNRVNLAKVLPLSTPFSVYIFPTTYCNFKCNYCAHSLGYKEMKKVYDFAPETMNMETFNNTIKGLREFPEKIKVVFLMGQGEPLLNKNIAEMIKIIKEAEICERIEIISNGALLKKEMADNLIESGLDILRISLQGITSEKYKEVCGVGLDFNDYIKNLKYYFDNKKEHMKLFVKTLDVTLEEGQEQDFYKLFEDISDRMFIEKIQPAYDGVESTKHIESSTDRYGVEHDKREVCPACFYMLGIFPNGDVEPCDTIYKPVVLGNVNNKSLLEMWTGEQLKEFWKLHLTKSRYDNPKCKVCSAPDDIARPEDVLDEYAQEIISRL